MASHRKSKKRYKKHLSEWLSDKDGVYLTPEEDRVYIKDTIKNKCVPYNKKYTYWYCPKQRTTKQKSYSFMVNEVPKKETLMIWEWLNGYRIERTIWKDECETKAYTNHLMRY